jgi:hypothetical protein
MMRDYTAKDWASFFPGTNIMVSVSHLLRMDNPAEGRAAVAPLPLPEADEQGIPPIAFKAGGKATHPYYSGQRTEASSKRDCNERG